MKIAFLGNCQAQSLQQWVRIDAPELDVVLLPPVWTLAEKDEAEFIEKFDSCDFLFCQRVENETGPRFVQTRFLKQKYGKKAISWPNVYFDGYSPGIRYLYGEDGKKIVGPLDDYHFDFVIEGFRKGTSVAQCARYMTTDDIFNLHPKPVHDSIRRLTEREEELDVRICDFLIRMMGWRRLVFSMNHPVDLVLKELRARLLGAAGLNQTLTSDSPVPYPLNKIILPIFPAVKDRYYLADELGQTTYKGVKPIESSDGKLMFGEETHLYQVEELIDTFYRHYSSALMPKT